MSERRRAPLPSRPTYFLRLLRGFLLATGLVAFSLGIGIVGYHIFSGLGWVDATLNASMILTGMGPVDPMRTTAAKLFASAYALFSGVAFLTMAALLFAPVIHRFLHRFHLELEDEDSDGPKAQAPARGKPQPGPKH
jgi:hypothetical protein